MIVGIADTFYQDGACDNCDHGTADDDLIISYVTRTDPFNDAGKRDRRRPVIRGSVHQKPLSARSGRSRWLSVQKRAFGTAYKRNIGHAPRRYLTQAASGGAVK